MRYNGRVYCLWQNVDFDDDNCMDFIFYNMWVIRIIIGLLEYFNQ